MEPLPLLLLSAAVLGVAFLYSSVGHAGASGYIAVMALFQVAPDAIKPVALVLNILVAVIASVQFWRAGHFSWRLFWPFALLSVPMAFVGGYFALPAGWLKPLLGVVLLASAARFLFKQGDPAVVRAPGHPLAVGVGGAIGLLSGWTGTGGGIFLTPVMLLCKWARTKQVAAVSAAFILLNSVSGLAGHLSKGGGVPIMAWQLAGAAILGGLAGSYCGSRKWPVRTIQIVLSAVLVMGGVKLLLT